MRLISDIDELLALKGKNMAFFYGLFSPPHFAQIEFIQQAMLQLPVQHLIICSVLDNSEMDFKMMRHRLAMMDLVRESDKINSEIYVLSHELCQRAQNQVTFDDMLHVLKRRGKKIYMLLPCQSFESCSGFFDTKEIIFVFTCWKKGKPLIKNHKANNKKLVLMDNLPTCTPEIVQNNIQIQGAYLPPILDKYLIQHHYKHDKTSNPFN
ncbi:MAG: hypothetical protein CVU09_07060 [Bacteroidetes bacterium HGW-Bacteroidetes-4]|jgi:hypothetical protein|nr:MAG: hypothetical protein CVU09_07060 [Bacteroidetes bacterium HGW-Bacteroidetes-4]